MPVCSKCGAEHEVLDPVFARPEAYVRLPRDDAQQHAEANDDLCRIALPDTATRFFVRGTLAVKVAGLEGGMHWGLWAEVGEETYRRIFDLWSDEEQHAEPPFEGALANEIPTYPTTVGLKLSVQLTGPRTRPHFTFANPSPHPFVAECLAGVTLHRAHAWNALIGAR
jgi:hypothetical protein